jgi:hypothetical protein
VNGPNVAEFRPSQVYLWRGLFPLVGCFGRSEREFAAGILVRACLRNGDAWGPITPQQLGESLQEDVKEEPWATFQKNPFIRPDFADLVAEGFAAWDDDPHVNKSTPIRFTDRALEILRTCVEPARSGGAS